MKYTKELLDPVAAKCVNYAEVVRGLGMKPHGQTIQYVKAALIRCGVDIGHFTGKSRNNRGNSAKKLSHDQILVRNRLNRKESTEKLRRALLEMGREHTCSVCGLGEVWRGNRLVLQTDHIGGDWSNNTPENLRFICPNCHSQTVNFCSKNRGRFAAQEALMPRVATPKMEKPAPKNKRKRRTIGKRDLVARICTRCTRPYIIEAESSASNSGFCGVSCLRGGQASKYPHAGDLAGLLEMMPATAVARKIGVTSTALKKHCIKIRVDTKPRGYWAKRAKHSMDMAA